MGHQVSPSDSGRCGIAQGQGDHLSPGRRFFKSPNFDGWYRQRHREMTQKLEALHLEVICEAVSGDSVGHRGAEAGPGWEGEHLDGVHRLADQGDAGQTQAFGPVGKVGSSKM